MGYQTRPKPTKANLGNIECGFPITALPGVKRKFGMFRMEALLVVERDEIRLL